MFKSKNNHERGQSLVEMAITMPVLILILSGLIDLGRLYYTAIVLEEAVAEAALYLAIDPSCPVHDDANKCHDPNNAVYRGEHVGGRQEIIVEQMEWNLDYENNLVNLPAYFKEAFGDCGKAVGCKVVIQARYQYDFITPGIEAIARGVTNDDNFYLQFQATQLIVFD